MSNVELLRVHTSKAGDEQVSLQALLPPLYGPALRRWWLDQEAMQAKECAAEALQITTKEQIVAVPEVFYEEVVKEVPVYEHQHSGAVQGPSDEEGTLLWAEEFEEKWEHATLDKDEPEASDGLQGCPDGKGVVFEPRFAPPGPTEPKKKWHSIKLFVCLAFIMYFDSWDAVGKDFSALMADGMAFYPAPSAVKFPPSVNMKTLDTLTAQLFDSKQDGAVVITDAASQHSKAKYVAVMLAFPSYCEATPTAFIESMVNANMASVAESLELCTGFSYLLAEEERINGFVKDPGKAIEILHASENECYILPIVAENAFHVPTQDSWDEVRKDFSALTAEGMAFRPAPSAVNFPPSVSVKILDTLTTHLGGVTACLGFPGQLICGPSRAAVDHIPFPWLRFSTVEAHNTVAGKEELGVKHPAEHEVMQSVEHEVQRTVVHIVAAHTTVAGYEQKHFCVDELHENEAQGDRKYAYKEDLLAKFEDLKQAIQEREDAIDMLKAEVAEMQSQLKRGGEGREKLNQDFQATIADQRETQRVFASAFMAVQGFYSESSAAKAAQTVLLQKGRQVPAGFKKYSKNASSGGVLEGPSEFVEERLLKDSAMMHSEIVGFPIELNTVQKEAELVHGEAERGAKGVFSLKEDPSEFLEVRRFKDSAMKHSEIVGSPTELNAEKGMFYLMEDPSEFLEERRLKDSAMKHSEIVGFPIERSSVRRVRENN